MHAVKPVFYSMVLRVNGQTQSLLSGEKITIHPKDRLRILKISTNVPFNMGIRLYCKMFDAQALVYDEYRVVDLMPEQVAFTNPRLNVVVKYHNKEAGHVFLLIRPFVGDWLDKASRTIDRKRRIALLEQGLKKVPGSEEIRKRLLNEYLDAGMLKKASRLLEEDAAKAPTKEVLLQLLDLYKRAGNDKGVISSLHRLINLDPRDKKSRYALAELLEKKGKISKAIAQYREIINLASPQERFDLYVKLGYLSAKAGKIEQAVKYYEEASSLHAKDENLYYNLSYLYEKLGKRGKADLYLEKALRLNGSDIEGRMRLAQRWIEKGKLKDAKVLLTQVLKKKPKSLKALLLMMEVADKSGNKAELKNIYKRILELQPNNATVLYNLGALEYEAGRFKSAAYYLRRYLGIKSKDRAAHGLLYEVYKQLEQPDKALAEAQILISLGSRDPDILAFVFETLKARKDYAKIESVMLKALKRDPKNTQLHKYLLFAYVQAGKEGKAMAELEKLTKLEPKNAELWLHLARLREKNGKYGEAMAAYKRVVELDPNNEKAADAYLKLRLRGFEEKWR